jgi:hypothetical protein
MILARPIFHIVRSANTGSARTPHCPHDLFAILLAAVGHVVTQTKT